MAELAIVRPIHPLPGRESAAVEWLESTEEERRRAGQRAQYVLRSIVDRADFVFVQVWESRAAYDRWYESDERKRLSAERQNYLTHQPTRMYEVL